MTPRAAAASAAPTIDAHAKAPVASGMTLPDGHDAPAFDLGAKYSEREGVVYLTGIQALVRVPLDHIRNDRAGGLRTLGFISGYPGSPLGGFDQELIGRKALLREHGIHHEPGFNEELAATSVMGSQTAARFGPLRGDSLIGIWYGKAPGLDRSGDPLRHAPYFAPTFGNGALAYVGDDPGDKSSTIPSGSMQTLADLNMATFYPGNTQEALDFGLHGLALSRACGIWSALKIDTPVADGSGTVHVSPDRFLPALDDVAAILATVPKPHPTRNAMITIEHEIHDFRLAAARQYGADNNINVVTHQCADAWLGIIAAGQTYYQVMEALQSIGLGTDELRRFGIRIMRLGMVHPLDDEAVRRFADGLSELLVVEEKRPFLETAIRSALYGRTAAPAIISGKKDPAGEPLVPSFGWLDAAALMEPLVRRITSRVDETLLKLPAANRKTRIPLQVVPRTPYFCSGCPHNTSLKVPEGSKVAGGIGCHSMVVFLDAERAGDLTGVTQMGGEGMQWVGVAPFVETNHIFQNLGDGTYFHSGQLCVQAAVAAGVNITYKILYNRVVAMTGGQDAVGALDVPDMVAILARQGVKKIVITTEDRERYRRVRLPDGVEVWDRNRILEAQELLRDIEGVTVLIHDQQCAAEARRLRKRGDQPEPTTSVLIAERVCEGCGDCGVYSNCLSLQPLSTEFGDKTMVDQSTCNKDYSCLHGDCPSFITLVPDKPTLLRRVVQRRSQSVAPRGYPGAELSLDEQLPEPTLVVQADDFAMRMPGIGGTGVVTVAQIVGTAALLDGRYVNSLDQTGLSQKGGSVVSDVRVSKVPITGANKLSAGSLDLYLVFDVIGALAPANLDAASSERTIAIVSTTNRATGLMIGRPTMKQPGDAEIQAALDDATRADRNVYFDADRLTRGLFGRTTSANLFALGVAYQAGALPIGAGAIEQAIQLNGVAADVNVKAFRWGRLFVLDPDRVEHAVGATVTVKRAADPRVAELVGNIAGGELRRLLTSRVAELVEFQNWSCAERYMAVIHRAAAAETAAAPTSTAFTEAVARNLFKLMAYKDEYEVARLHLEPSVADQIALVANGKPMVASWNLHPPVLRSLGMKNKITLGPSARPLMVGLKAMKRLRGTPLDIFGYAEVRRTERQLIEEYVEIIGRICEGLRDDNMPAAAQIAGLPDLVRGYETVKLKNVEKYRSELARLLADAGF